MTDILWQENLNDEINGFRCHGGVWGQGRLGCYRRIEEISQVKDYTPVALFVFINRK